MHGDVVVVERGWVLYYISIRYKCDQYFLLVRDCPLICFPHPFYLVKNEKEDTFP
jgi:hypothetical protein